MPSATSCAPIPLICSSIWLRCLPNCSISRATLSRRAKNKLLWPSISSFASGFFSPAVTNSSGNLIPSTSSRCASRRPRRAISSNSCPSMRISSDSASCRSSCKSRSPTLTRSPSSTRISAIVPPVLCCTTCLLRSTSMRPDAIIAPAMLEVTDHVPNPPNNIAMPMKPIATGRHALHLFALLMSRLLCPWARSGFLCGSLPSL